MRFLGKTIPVTMMQWPPKRDFRLRSEALRSAGAIGDILRVEKVDPTAGHEYEVEVVRQGTGEHSACLALCRHSVRNSGKRYGYY